MSHDPDRLAVYGTLTPEGSNAAVLEDLDGEWALGTIRATRYDEGWRGYPGIVLDGGGDVRVAVLHSAGLADAWERLDSFEGPGYRRVVTEVALDDDGGVVRAFVYELVDPPS